MSGAPGTRTPSGRFQPGQSGNPTGRPKAVHDFQRLAREATPAAFERLVELSHSRNAAVAVRACELIVSWGVGRPQQSVAVAGAVAMPTAFIGAARAALEQAIADAEAATTPALPPIETTKTETEESP